MLSTPFNGEWRNHALCVHYPSFLFFIESSEAHSKAKAICDRCPVKTECLEHAIQAPEDYGIWGGMTLAERRRERVRRLRGVP